MSWRLRVLIVLTVLGASPLAHAQDFDPRGRRKPQGGSARPAGGRPTGKPRPSGGATPRPGPAAATGDRPASGDADALIERYTRIVLSQPGSAFPLQRLAALYRQRDGGIERALGDFEKRTETEGAERYAATVALAGLLKSEGRTDEAVRRYQAAIAQKPSDPAAILALGRLHHDRAELEPARKLYEQALPLQTQAAEREQLLRTLLILALDQKDFAAAKGFHTSLVKDSHGSLFVKAELGRELYARGEYARAADELKDVVAASQGDNRVLAPALKDYGRALAKAERGAEALDVLRRALRAAGSQAGVRGELYEAIAEVYRKQQRLPELVTELEKEGGNDAARQVLLASLYEETGDTEKAIAAYKRALSSNPRNLDLRLKVVRLYQARGELDRAITEYEALVRAAPNNPTFVFELTDALLQRGERARVLTILAEVERRARGDEDILGRIADYYGRLGENAKAVALLERLAQSSGADAGHIVDLGDRYFQSGNVALAQQTWRRILTTVQPRAKALSTLADVYLEHDMPAEALALVQEAIGLEKNNVALKKQLAAVLERNKRPGDAQALWRELLDHASQSQDVLLAREARARLVSSWSLQRNLDKQVAPLEKAFDGKPADLEAGRLLAEVMVRLRKPERAQATLEKLLQLAPGDVDSYLALERVLQQRGKTAEAIVVLEKLAGVDPKRARELYQRMADYAMSLYRDQDAIRYATKAAELNPDDAEGHRRLGDLHRRKQEADKAIVAYRKALAKNERLYVVYFQLAELLAARGEVDEATRLLRKVLQSTPDDELVLRAARQSMQLLEVRGELATLEADLLPLALGSPGRPVFRRLLMEMYGTLTARWQREASSGPPEQRTRAREALAKTGQRALKILLDALADKDPNGQRIAIDLLAHEGNTAAALPLLSFATSDADSNLRVRAMLALGELGEAGVGARLAKVVEQRSEQGSNVSGRVAAAAVWSLGRQRDKTTLPALRKVLASGSTELRALAAVGLARDNDPKTQRELWQLAGASDQPPLLRAFAILGTHDTTLLAEPRKALAWLREADPRIAVTALLRLGRAPLDASARGELAQGAADWLYRPSRGDLDARAVALHVLGGADAPAASPLASGSIDANGLLVDMMPPAPSSEVQAATLTRHQQAVVAALEAALTGNDATRRLAALQALASGPGQLEPFSLTAATPAADQVAQSVQSTLVRVVARGERRESLLAIAALGRIPTAEAEREVAARIAGGGDVGQAALESLGANLAPVATPQACQAALTASQATDFATRLRAVEALQRLGNKRHDAAIGPRLSALANGDEYALVRDRALRALQQVDPVAARRQAEHMARHDAEQSLRTLGQTIAQGRTP